MALECISPCLLRMSPTFGVVDICCTACTSSHVITSRSLVPSLSVAIA